MTFKIILCIILCGNISNGNIDALQTDFKSSIIGHWKSNSVMNISAEIDFFKNSTGKIKWSNGLQCKFKYVLKDSILKITRANRFSEHLISKLDENRLELKAYNSHSQIGKNADGTTFVSEEIEFINELDFSKVQ